MKTCPNCSEILGDSIKICFKCNYSFEFKKILDRNETTQTRIESENKMKEQQQLAEQLATTKKIMRETQLERNPQFEYISVIINDLEDGTINETLLQRTLTTYAAAGWRLHSIFTNEVGKSVSSVVIGFLGTSINATIDQTVLIFERCIKAEVI